MTQRKKSALFPLSALSRLNSSPLAEQRRTLDARLDTGFTGSLGISSELARTLRWQLDGYVEATLASGAAVLAVFIGEVIFDGQRQVLRAVEIASGDVIIGLAVLWDKRLLADFWTRVVLVE